MKQEPVADEGGPPTLLLSRSGGSTAVCEALLAAKAAGNGWSVDSSRCQGPVLQHGVFGHNRAISLEYQT